MRVCDLATGMGQITHAFSDLKEKWAESNTHWNDDTSRQFEKLHLAPIVPQLQLLISAVQRLAEVLAQAEKECSE